MIDRKIGHLNSVGRILLFQDEAVTMRPIFAKADGLSTELIGSANLVHRIMGPGLLASSVPIGLFFNFHAVKVRGTTLRDGRRRVCAPAPVDPR